MPANKCSMCGRFKGPGDCPGCVDRLETDRVKKWNTRIKAGENIYKTWASEYECERLYNYYLGKQHRGFTEEEARKLYTINLFFPTIEIKQAALLEYNPKVRVQPRPTRQDDAESQVEVRAQVEQDTLQTLIDDPNLHFKDTIKLAMRDAEFYFGVVEVGYTADWVDNPNAGKPMLRDENDPESFITDEKGEPVLQPEKIQEHEKLYLKHIPPESCRVSVSGKNILEQNDWFAYSEWHYVDDVKANPDYVNLEGLKATGHDTNSPTIQAQDGDASKYAGMVKLWKVWDLRSKTKHVIAEGHERFLVEGKAFTTFPIRALKYHERRNEWYPLPPTYNWLSLQDEKNEIRQQQKVHRQRFDRKYLMRTDSIDASEVEKLTSGGDGTIATHRGQPGEMPLMPIPDAPLDASIWNNLAATDDDWNNVTGVGGEQRGDAESETATQASIIESRTKIRESSTRQVVNEWLSGICRLMLLTIRDEFQLPFLIQLHADPFAPDVEKAAQQAGSWQEVTADQFGDLDFDVSIDIGSMSEATQKQEQFAWNQVLALLTNPALGGIMAMSPAILRKTLRLYGIQSEAEIREIQKVLQQQMMMQVAAQAAQAGMGGPAAGGGEPAQEAVN
jgi:hypothetical protein